MDRLTMILIAGSALFNATANTFMKAAFGNQKDLSERFPQQDGPDHSLSPYGGPCVFDGVCRFGAFFLRVYFQLEDWGSRPHSGRDMDYLCEGLSE